MTINIVYLLHKKRLGRCPGAQEHFVSRVKRINRIMGDTIFITEEKVLPMEIVSPK